MTKSHTLLSSCRTETISLLGVTMRETFSIFLIARLRRSTHYKALAGEVLDTEVIPVYLSVISLYLNGSAATRATTEKGHQAEGKYLQE